MCNASLAQTNTTSKMWHWDQGRLAYFQFEALQRISAFVMHHDFKLADRSLLASETGLLFQAPPTHSPWRNYSRVLKLCLLIYERSNVALATPVASILSQPGTVTCDEYMHFLVQVSTEPSPALADWRPEAEFRYPLLFCLKYLLMKTATGAGASASVKEIIGAYHVTGFTGDEDETEFAYTLARRSTFEEAGANAPEELKRQARESLRVISQISYLHLSAGDIIQVSLAPEDGRNVFLSLNAISGPRATNRNDEILRLADLFQGGSTMDDFEYPNTILSDVVESGFIEGSKVKKSHIIIERNTNLRKAFFEARPTSVCDMCRVDTAKTYVWTNRILDLHHLLPLSSGTRVESTGTTFKDLVAICPTCHRATHRYYDRWLNDNHRKDFASAVESRDVYQKMKTDFTGFIYA